MFKKGFKFFEGHREPMMEIVGIEDTGIEVTIAHVADVGEAGLEVLIGHRTRVLEFTEDGVIEAEEIAVWDESFEGFLTVVGDTVLGTREPCKEVCFSMVFKIGVEMMTLAVIGFALAVEEYLPFTIESQSTKNMA